LEENDNVKENYSWASNYLWPSVLYQTDSVYLEIGK
jgi:hypothetical protein